jgi:hypothetical protein
MNHVDLAIKELNSAKDAEKEQYVQAGKVNRA